MVYTVQKLCRDQPKNEWSSGEVHYVMQSSQPTQNWSVPKTTGVIFLVQMIQIHESNFLISRQLIGVEKLPIKLNWAKIVKHSYRSKVFVLAEVCLPRRPHAVLPRSQVLSEKRKWRRCCCSCFLTRSSLLFYLLNVFPFGCQSSLLLWFSRNFFFLFCCPKMSRLPLVLFRDSLLPRPNLVPRAFLRTRLTPP